MKFIYIYYKDISQKLVDSIANYFTYNKDKLKAESILFLFEKINYRQFLTSILNKINSFIIKKEELFRQEKEIDSFKLLDGILKKELITKYPELSDTNYLKSTLELSSSILNDIKTGNIKYGPFFSIWTSKEKKNILIDKLNIILLNNKKDVDMCIREFDERYKKIIKIIKELKKILTVLREFYERMHQENIQIIGNLEKQMNEGLLKDIENEEIKNKIDEMYKSIPDLDKKVKLKGSVLFTNIFKDKKANNPIKKEDDIFNETMGDFIKLKGFFNEDWINNIDELIIKECYKAFKNIDDKKKLSELKFLRDYFEIKDKNDLFLEKLLDEIKIFSKKEEIFQTVNSCIYFILEFKVKKNDNQEFGVKRTEFFDALTKLRAELSQNISVKDIRKHGELLEKYGPSDIHRKLFLKWIYPNHKFSKKLPEKF